MPRECIIRECAESSLEHVPMFTFPSQENQFKEWKKNIGGRNVGSNDVICIKHFEEKYICRYEQAYDSNFEKKANQKSKVCLTRDAKPTLFLTPDDDYNMEQDDKSNEESVKSQMTTQQKKRGSSGLANLQKARMRFPSTIFFKKCIFIIFSFSRKMLRRERMKNLLKKRASQKSKSQTGSETSEYDVEKDYFLGNRQETHAEKLIIPLRMIPLLKKLCKKTNLVKNPPASVKNTATFPTFSIISHIDGLNEGDRNPLHWTTDETFLFIKYISPVKSIAKSFRLEEIDGEAMLNLTKNDLVKHFHLDTNTADSLDRIFSQLRKEIIQRFINV